MEFLPEACIATILSRTTPVDAARLSMVSKTFRSAADSDVVWDRFLPSDFNSIVSQYCPSLANAPSKKALYLALSDHPIIIDQGKKSFQLEKKSGKKWYMLAARALSLAWGDIMSHWGWETCPQSRFGEVAVLRFPWWLDISGMINTLSLSPNTHYGAFLVFKIINTFPGGYGCRLGSSINIGGDRRITKTTYLIPQPDGGEVVGLRHRDGWLEIELGEFFNSGLQDEQVTMAGYLWASDFIVEGIQIRPKEDN